MDKQLPILLGDNPIAKEYIIALLSNGQDKEAKTTKELIEYIDTLEKQFDEVISEIKELRKTVEQLQNPKTRSILKMGIEKTEHIVKVSKNMIIDIKNQFIGMMKQSLDECKRQGKNTVIKSVDTLHIKSSLHSFNKHLVIYSTLDAFSKKIDVVSNEIRKAKRNLKNAGLLLVGKKIKQYSESDLNKLNVLQKVTRGTLNKIENLSIKTAQRLNRLDSFTKSSVKQDLKTLGNSFHSKKIPIKEISR
ncbi:DUF6674 family protein [Thomasclavelia cocleata]|uniref:DUF6674 family protein n=1 Tax=Thomasclavelia cocleata TaxID=69824 RepID=UPI002431BA66|nr:DUF6674 family protein [Thomasclavelia cocleata]